MFSIQIINSNPMTYAVVNQDRYWSVLSGAQQLPPVNTSAIGYAGFKFPDDMTWLIYTVNAENIGNVTGIYLYQNDKNQSGTIVLDLLKAEREHHSDDAKIVNTTSKGKITGTLSVGGATKDNLQGQLKGKSVSDLHEMMVNGTVYVIIHTKDFPNGEIRGNSFVGIDRLFPDFTDIKWE
jgi:CHRD domain-containing protein